jgi:membrane associated rhomboid family serine protease
MLPLGDDNSARRRVPFVTFIILILNVIIFLVELARGDDFILRWAFVPSRFSSNTSGSFITIFTSMFMHASWAHLIGNMLYLFIHGDNVEDRFGHLKYVIFYLLSGVAATLAQYVLNKSSEVPLVGASGAISGVLGAYLVMFPRNMVRVRLLFWIVPVRAFVSIGSWFIMQLFLSYLSIGATGEGGGVAYAAHIGGFIAGVILTFFFRKKT